MEREASSSTPSRGAGKGRSRGSPPPSSTDHPSGESRPPTKRARKAVNCEPCRASKLKCDRSRPCSSCVLRGTTAHCYQDGRGHEGGTSVQVRGDPISPSGYVDPAQEIARIRHSVNLLESHLLASRNQYPPPVARSFTADLSNPLQPKVEGEADGSSKEATAPGMLGGKSRGLYAGPTSAATHLIVSLDSRDSEESDRQPQEDPFITHDYDRDLLALLPTLETIDELITFYFDYCNWIYRHVNQKSFTEAWSRYKAGQTPDRIILATFCVIMAIAVHYLPIDHALFESSTDNHEEMGEKFYDVMRTALQRHQAESRAYTLELVELLLVRCHFLTLSKKDSEEIWTVRGELITIGVAMGLHRDPGRWKMPLAVAERRRWAWWHIILLERWQAFMFGRPISIASDHFDTELPAYCDPALDPTGRLYLPNIALFRLAYILGDIMTDAVSLRPVPYDSVLANDRALTQWLDELPRELDLDDYRVARSLASPTPSVRRLGVQSVIIRTSYYHIRFTLHRPYASAIGSRATGKSATPSARMAQSMEIAVAAADTLITLVGQAQPDFFNNTALAVPGHMNWGPFHVFSASMFFSFQLIANPDQPGASLFRKNIRKAIATLEQSQGLPLANKAWKILNVLSPLYSHDFAQQSQRDRDRKKASIMAEVKSLAFPYHDSPTSPRAPSDSHSSPANSHSLSPPGSGVRAQEHSPSMMQAVEGQGSANLPPMSALRSMSDQDLPSLAPYTHPPPAPPPHMMQALSSPSGAHTQHQQSPSMVAGQSFGAQQNYSATQQQQQMYGGDPRYQSFMNPAEEGLLFGASAGIAMGEWQWFRDYSQRGDSSRGHGQ
ncbi:hypothetical protein PLICRDRAFT_96706 [Plicaturopsis crispa FD-325 SS-3]|nr:hypothetical protein PLICRDRAFT_96706 [Plicaturopsis crispa FD-325 SS-3]